MARKCNWHYAPKTITTMKDGSRPVVGARVYPPGQHPAASPIVKTMTAVQLTNDRGNSRWYGFDDARIAANLRLVACGGFINPRNEIAKNWKRCGKICDNLSGSLAGARKRRRRRR